MSHIVTIETKVHDSAAVAAACQRLNLPAAKHGTVELFSPDYSMPSNKKAFDRV